MKSQQQEGSEAFMILLIAIAFVLVISNINM